ERRTAMDDPLVTTSAGSSDHEPVRSFGQHSFGGPGTPAMDTAMLFDEWDASRAVEPCPRGLRANGTIRTTGWLQLGSWPVSSGVFAALTGFALGTVLVAGQPALPVILAAAGYLSWKITTGWVLPASRA